MSMRGVWKKQVIITVIALILTTSTLASAAPRIVVLSNDIDFGMASEFFGFLGNRGIETIRATPAEFEEYKSERFIVILGGPDAYEGVGGIVQGILSTQEQNTIRELGNRRMYVKTNPWGALPGQRVTVLAGSDRNETKKAHEENRQKVASDAQAAGGTSGVQVSIQGFKFVPSQTSIVKGTTVVWTNKDTAAHTTSSIGMGWDSGSMAKDDTFSFTFNEAGTFDYQCNFHPSMKGKITVTDTVGSTTY